jgi:hypothetical protein
MKSQIQEFLTGLIRRLGLAEQTKQEKETFLQS